MIQARADGIIKNMPYRNIVAIKTCQGTYILHAAIDDARIRVHELMGVIIMSPFFRKCSPSRD